MTISTVEDLRALSEGTQILVVNPDGTNRTTWTRTAPGFTSGTAVIEPDMLTGLVKAGLVSRAENADPIPGEWWQSRTVFLRVLAVNTEAKTVRCLSFHRSAFTATQTEVSWARLLTGGRYRRLEGMPVEVQSEAMMSGLLDAYMTLKFDFDRLHEQVAELAKRPDPVALRSQIQDAKLRLDRILTSLGGD